MGAHPKNKVTRVEQGKRRRGNTPKLKRENKNEPVPLYKRSLAERFAKAVAGATEKPAQKKSVKTAKAGKPTPKPSNTEVATVPAKKAAPKKTAAKSAAKKKTE